MRSSFALLRATSLLTIAVFAFVACGGSSGGDSVTTTPPPSPSPVPTADPNCSTPAASATESALANGGFEAGREPWTSLATENWGPPFELSQAQARSGANSAYLQLRSEDGGATRVYGVVQELGPGELPETLSGYYYVENWEQGTPKQYLQFVVIVTAATNIPQQVVDLNANNHQVRYILAGVDSQPTDIANSRYVMVSTEQPAVGRWVRFERNVRQDFCELWGSLPVGYTGIRVLFETRWDERKDTDAPSSADVYYDDLSWGTAGVAP